MTGGFVRTDAKGPKRIPEPRDRLQRRAILAVAGTLVLYATGFALLVASDYSGMMTVALISAAFALVVVAARASSTWGALWGGICCFTLTMWTRRPASSPAHSLLPALVALVVLTFLATRFGKARKTAKGLGEPAADRAASQVLANLSAAVLFVSPIGAYAAVVTGSNLPVNTALLVTASLAALAEAAADTVSSEVGQVLAPSSRTILITTLRRVPRGTDGGVSVVGTLCGLVAALVVTWVGVSTSHMSLGQGVAALIAAVLAFLFDSVLGATLERRGWIGNDFVNFSSTIVAGLLALLLARPLVGG